MSDSTVVQPCEICGKTSPTDADDKYEDIYSPARPGSLAAIAGLKEERLCGRCSCAQFLGSYWNGDPNKKGQTPIEEYQVRGCTVYVKRDDLWMGGKYAGGNAKLRGAMVHLRALQAQGIDHVAVLDARVSRGGWGLAQICQEIGIKCTVFYGVLKGHEHEVPYFQQQAAKAGADLHPFQAAKVSIMFFRARAICKEQGVHLVPMGLMFPEAMLSVAGEVSATPPNLLTGDFIVCVGTGMMISGILLGIPGANLQHLYGVNVGMTDMELNGTSKTNVEQRVANRIRRTIPSGLDPYPFTIKLADRVFYDADDYPVPFQCDQWYDRKAWRWLNEHINELKDPILFWNIG